MSERLKSLQHRLFVVNADTAQCMDCRRDFNLPEINDKYKTSIRELWTEADWLDYHKQRMALLTPDYWIYAGVQIGYCTSTRKQYYNPTRHTLNLSGLGIPEVKPGEIFELGSANPILLLKKYAPQIKAIADINRVDTGDDIWPLTVDEFVRYTIRVGDMNDHLSFSGAPSDR